MTRQYVDTPVGQASIDWFDAVVPARTVLVLGHGTATGVEAPDLQALASALPPHGVTVALVTQPYRLALQRGGRDRAASDEAALDVAWRAVWAQVVGRVAAGTPLVAGGRSAGSQVACRTARGLGAKAVVALAYPLRGPGRPSELLATDLPMLIVQGGRDPYGTPDRFPALPPGARLIEVPSAGHMFSSTAARGADTRPETGQVVDAVATWIGQLFAQPAPRS